MNWKELLQQRNAMNKCSENATINRKNDLYKHENDHLKNLPNHIPVYQEFGAYIKIDLEPENTIEKTIIKYEQILLSANAPDIKSEYDNAIIEKLNKELNILRRTK